MDPDRLALLLETKRQIIAGVLAAQQSGANCLMPRYFALDLDGHLDWEPITPEDVRAFAGKSPFSPSSSIESIPTEH